MEMLREMKKVHEDNGIDFEALREKLKQRKKAFMDHLQKMREKLRGHGDLFQPVQTLTDKLPRLFEHFKNMLKSLSKKPIADSSKSSAESTSSESTSSESSNNIEQHEQTVEEEAFGPNSDKDDDTESAATDTETEEATEDEAKEEEEAQEGQEADLDGAANSLDEKLKEINEHPNFVSLDDGLLDQLEQEQKEFELRQKELNDHVNGFKQIDDGLVHNGKRRRHFNDRFVKFLDSDEMKSAPGNAKNHLHNLDDLFNAREH